MNKFKSEKAILFCTVPTGPTLLICVRGPMVIFWTAAMSMKSGISTKTCSQSSPKTFRMSSIPDTPSASSPTSNSGATLTTPLPITLQIFSANVLQSPAHQAFLIKQKSNKSFNKWIITISLVMAMINPGVYGLQANIHQIILFANKDMFIVTKIIIVIFVLLLIIFNVL